MLTARFLYSDHSDYFSGYGCADDAEHSEYLLYAFYGKRTTLREIIDQLVEDSYSGPASMELPEEVTDSDVRAALMGMLSDVGRANYESNAAAECATDLVEACDGGDDEDEDEDDYYEYPVFIVVLDYEKPKALTDASDCPDS